MSTPFYASERNFRRFEALIAEAVRAFPHVVVKTPSDYRLAPTTFVARLRDAINSFSGQRWPSTLIDPVLFAAAYPTIQVSWPSNLGGRILIGGPESIKTYAAQDQPLPVVVSTPSSALLAYTFCPVGLRAICRLAAERLLSQPVLLRMEPQVANSLLEGFDIDLEPNADGTYTLT